MSKHLMEVHFIVGTDAYDNSQYHHGNGLYYLDGANCAVWWFNGSAYTYYIDKETFMKALVQPEIKEQKDDGFEPAELVSTKTLLMALALTQGTRAAENYAERG